MTTIPQCNPKAGYLTHRAAIDAAVAAVLAGGDYILGPAVAAFENEFKQFLGVQYAIGVANGTDALELALRACGVRGGDGVVTVANTATATVAAIERAGAVPMFVDIATDTYTMDPSSLAALLANSAIRKPVAVIPVHLYGHPADMPAILELANRHDLYVIEDCAQAHGASRAGKKIGGWGHLGAFSFYPTKNLGAFGDGGCVVTNDSKLESRVRQLRQYGWELRYISAFPGVNSRLDELQAAILRVKLQHLEDNNRRRREIAARYQERFRANDRLRLPSSAQDITHVYHQYVVRTQGRDSLRSSLAQNGVMTAIHYPVPIHLQPAYKDRIPLLVPLDNTERMAGEIVSLPMFPEMSDDAVDRVANLVNRLSMPST